jgi:hypothetical protein
MYASPMRVKVLVLDLKNTRKKEKIPKCGENEYVRKNNSMYNLCE